MKLTAFGALLVLASLAIQPAFAQETEAGDPGITPDSFLYGLDVALDRINLLLTFDQAEKSRKGLDIARERLLEIREMALENKVAAMERAASEHDSVLAQVESSVQELERDDASSELEEVIEIERELLEHQKRVENVEGEIRVKIKVVGGITPEQRDLVDSILSGMENRTGKVEIEIEIKKDKTKVKTKSETGKSDEEIEEEIRSLEEAKGVAALKRERAEDRIEDAIEEIEEARGLLGNETSTLLDQAEERLSKAESAFDEGKFGEAFGQATAARRIAKAVKEQLEEERGGEEEKEEQKIEVEIRGGRAKVDVEIGEAEDKFVLNTTDRGEIIAAIAERTGLTADEVREAVKFEEGHGKEDEGGGAEIEVEITDGTAEIKTEMEGKETEFSLDTTDKEAIIAALSERTGLTAEEIERITEWKVRLGEQKRGVGKPEGKEAVEESEGEERGGRIRELNEEKREVEEGEELEERKEEQEDAREETSEEREKRRGGEEEEEG
jgi:hypothetical protein